MSSVNKKALLASYRISSRVAIVRKITLFHFIRGFRYSRYYVCQATGRKAQKYTFLWHYHSTQDNQYGDWVSWSSHRKIKKSSYVSSQFYESTGIEGCAQFVDFVRSESSEKLMEEILFPWIYARYKYWSVQNDWCEESIYC